MILLEYGYQWGNIFLVVFACTCIIAFVALIVIWVVRAFKRERKEAQNLQSLECIIKAQDLVNERILAELATIKEKLKIK